MRQTQTHLWPWEEARWGLLAHSDRREEGNLAARSLITQSPTRLSGDSLQISPIINAYVIHIVRHIMNSEFPNTVSSFGDAYKTSHYMAHLSNRGRFPCPEFDAVVYTATAPVSCLLAVYARLFSLVEPKAIVQQVSCLLNDYTPNYVLP